jgi:UMF1 family MFS transporter
MMDTGIGKGWEPVRRREVWAWAFFDFANSSFTTVMVTVLFPVYFLGVVAPSAELGQRAWGWAGAVANGLVVVLGPLLGYWADRRGRKKVCLLWTTVVCVVGTVLCGVLPGGEGWWWWVWVAFVVANVAFLIGENFVASFLPEISTHENVGRISSYGWGIGYLGGLASLLVAQRCGEGGMSFVVTGLFFAVASAPTFIFLRERGEAQKWTEEERSWMNPLQEMWGQVRRSVGLRWMLGIFFLISGGLSTVIYFASIFAVEELKMNRGELTVMFLALQVAAAIGALGTGWMQDRWGWRWTLGGLLAMWCGTVIGCGVVRSVEWFYVLATFAGCGIGGTQTCVRAALSLYTRVEDAGKVYGFWGCAGKLAPVIFLPMFGEIAATWGLRMALGVPLLGFLVAWLLVLACGKVIGGGDKIRKINE